MSSYSLNPYEAPREVGTGPEAPDPNGPTIKVHPAASVLIATFLGSFFAGCLVLAINLWKLGRGGQALILTASGFLAVSGLMVALYYLPVDVPSLVLLLAQMAAAYVVSRVVWEPVLRSVPPDRVKYASKWWAAAIGIVGCIPVGGLLLGFVLWEQNSLGRRVVIAGGNECYVSGTATEEDARFLGDYLLEEEFLREGGHAIVMLSKQGSRYTVFLVLAEGFEDPDTIAWVEHAGKELARRRFGKPLFMVLKDEALYERRRLTIE